MTIKFPSFPREHIYSEDIESISIIGEIHPKKWRWNPFNESLDLKRISSNIWSFTLDLIGSDDERFEVAYSIRLVINHNFQRQLKVKSFFNNKWILQEESSGQTFNNINFYSTIDQKIEFIFNTDKRSC